MSVRSPPHSPKRPQQPSNKANLHTRNIISPRLYKVLGTNFNDEATKEALRTLSDLYVLQTATSGTSTFVELVPGESAARARKNLRRDMENKLAEGSRQFLRAFGEVDRVSEIGCILMAENRTKHRN